MTPPDKRTKVIILFVASWAGVIFLLAIGIVKFPTYLSERQRLLSLKAKLTDSNELETRMNSFIEAFKTRIDAVNSEIASRNTMLQQSTFSRLPESEIPPFVDALPKLVASAGVNLINLGYKTRENVEGFIDQPFEMHFSCRFQQMRTLLHLIESHPAGIRITGLEFITLDDSNHEAQLRLLCNVRFVAGG